MHRDRVALTIVPRDPPTNLRQQRVTPHAPKWIEAYEAVDQLRIKHANSSEWLSISPQSEHEATIANLRALQTALRREFNTNVELPYRVETQLDRAAHTLYVRKVMKESEITRHVAQSSDEELPAASLTEQPARSRRRSPR